MKPQVVAGAILAGWLLACAASPGMAQGREEPSEGSRFYDKILKELQGLSEGLDRLVKELERGDATRKEALTALESIRSGLRDLRARLNARFRKEPPGSAGRRLLEGALATLDGLDSWLQELQEKWGGGDPRWI